ncbi:hypothetical protein ACFL0U_01935 [Pseudomonadota bacterium]
MFRIKRKALTQKSNNDPTNITRLIDEIWKEKQKREKILQYINNIKTIDDIDRVSSFEDIIREVDNANN